MTATLRTVYSWRARIAIVGFCLLSCYCERGGAQDPELTIAALVFHPVTSYGDSPRFKVVSLKDTSGTDFARFCKGSTCGGFRRGPYDYQLRIEQNGRTVAGSGQFYAARQWLTIPLGQGIGDAGDFGARPFHGRVTGLPIGSTNVWIRLQMLYAQHYLERPLGANGEFSFEDASGGKWLVLILQDDKLLYNQPYALGTSESVTIDLTPR